MFLFFKKGQEVTPYQRIFHDSIAILLGNVPITWGKINIFAPHPLKDTWISLSRKGDCTRADVKYGEICL